MTTKDKPLVSIITVCLNSEKHIEQTIQSVISQTYDNIEYVIVDGGSTDGTLEIVKKYKPNIAKVLFRPPRGVFDAINFGIQAVSGDLIGIIHSDDYYADNTVIERVVRTFKQNQTIEIVYGRQDFLDRKTERVLFEWGRDCNPSEIKNRMYIPHPTVFCRRQVYNAVGLFKTKYPIAADYEWAMRVLKYTKPSFLDYKIACMRDMGQSGRYMIRAFTESTMALWENKYYISAMMEAIKSSIKYILIRCGLKSLVYKIWTLNVSAQS